LYRAAGQDGQNKHTGGFEEEAAKSFSHLGFSVLVRRILRVNGRIA
jgi:hypothetical protein